MSDNDNNSPRPDLHINHAGTIQYWNTIPATVDGMLGGYAQISTLDLRGSSAFLSKLRRLLPSSFGSSMTVQLGVDCGAGIGRVTNGLLSKICDVVDVVEPVEKFAAVVRTGKTMAEGKIGDIYVTGLQDWTPTKKYDLIWNQWCLDHLTDDQVVAYLIRCRGALSERGLVVIKENMNSVGCEDFYDDTDNTVTRAEESFVELFRRAGFAIVRAEEETGFPERLGLLRVKFFALRPEEP
ncbi:hypothetical protein AJ80_07801 [Polytolypa hystricis UAMH7299]|uniref:Alpha N-terminal protein methyltransferase 1 n=1 Tax=Polytolypa hystricis (strain UAMH7299) TaxID=1447883 RepID=A0A2B7XJ23_POLH7|nr:hypothetical protein AJ80_07801 [Polytolypa hystricis UAMH7299]